MSSEPPSGSGNAILLVAILALLVAGLVFWGWSAHSPRRPAPAASGIPPTAPASAPPTTH
jgi:hypothetical protein